MKTIGIIPARMGASRVPCKPLASILGMPMTGHCYRCTRLAPGLEAAYVATCDQPIIDYVESISGRAVMTSTSHNPAFTRSAEATLALRRAAIDGLDIHEAQGELS